MVQTKNERGKARNSQSPICDDDFSIWRAVVVCANVGIKEDSNSLLLDGIDSSLEASKHVKRLA
jgi:hypothetical protein